MNIARTTYGTYVCTIVGPVLLVNALSALDPRLRLGLTPEPLMCFESVVEARTAVGP